MKKGTKFIAVLSFIALLLILNFVIGSVQKSLSPKFATPQEAAEYIYKEEPEAIIFGRDSCLIFNRFSNKKIEYMISPCVEGKYEITAKGQSNVIHGKSILLRYINFVQVEGSNDQYVTIVGMGYPDEITVCDNKGTEFYVFFYEEQVEGTDYAPYFWAVGYLDTEDLSSYTVTVSDSNTSESISAE